MRGWFARKSFKAKRELIIHVQSCIRRNIARKKLLNFRSEARSVSHFKEVSYALENKVVELTQTLTAVRDERKLANDRSVQLEAQIKNWVDKYEKMERKAKNLDEKLQEPTVPKEQHDQLQAELVTLTSEHRITTEKVKSQDRELTLIKTQLETEKTANAGLKKSLEEAEERSKNATDESEVAELRSQLAALKTQLSQALHAPRRQGSNNALRGISPAPPGMRGPSPSPNRSLDPESVPRHRSRSPGGIYPAPITTTTTSTSLSAPNNRKPRRNSSADMLNGSRLKNSIENIRNNENFGKNPRPASIDHFNTLLGAKNGGGLSGAIDESPEEEIHSLLRNEGPLQEEILEGLIKSVKMPLPTLQNPPSQKEILFPAHTISVCVNEMWELGYIQESEKLLFNVMDTIQKQFLSFTDEDAVVPCTFWLTNVHELLSLICIAHNEIDQDIYQDKRKSVGRHDFSKLMETIKFEMQCLEDNIYHAWMKEIKKHLSKMVIPAVVEGQSLPGFITSDNGRFFNKLLIGTTQPTYSMDDLLNFLNKIWRTMKCYYIEQSVATQALTELLKLIGVSAFNDLLMRKNFCSWKRGKVYIKILANGLGVLKEFFFFILAMQIQYNITRIEEWCKSHDIPEGALQLEHLMQTTKLLQFKKATLEDIENIYDVCWILSPTQIQKLISQYYTADYENPIKPDILKAVASHVVSGDKSDVLLLDSVSIENTSNPFEVPVPRDTRSEIYLPSWVRAIFKNLSYSIVVILNFFIYFIIVELKASSSVNNINPTNQ